ncbi:AI-2E family transporter [uncultured archaeon]|nr:AI-2E family transporter [uncultured archaeon]
MANLNTKEEKIYLFVAVLILGLISYFIVKDFLTAILSSFIITYLLLPIQNYLSRHINKKLSAILIILAVFIIILVIGSSVAFSLTNEASQYLNKDSLIRFTSSISGYAEKIGIPHGNYYGQFSEKINEFILLFSVSVAKDIPLFIVHLIIIVFLTFFLLFEWNNFIVILKEIFPLKNKDEIMSRVGKTTKNIFYGYFLIAIIDFTIAFVGFKLAGLNGYFLLAFLIALFAFIPMLGPSIVWIPVFIFNLINNSLVSAGIILITGLLMTVLVDHFIAPTIVAKKSSIHPIIILLGVLGGIPIFGFFGFLIGPMVLSFFIEFLRDLKKIND